MHGIVNKAINGMIVEYYGQEKWQEIKNESNISEDYFLSDQAYPDEYTYSLVEACSKILKISAEEVLIAFGEYWILHTGKESYGSMFKAAGTSVGEFLLNLPGFHNRVMLIYPRIKAPEFKVLKKDDKNYFIHYYSEREGLQPFVKGLLSGIAKLFEANVIVTHNVNLSNKENGEVFHFEII